MLAPLPRRDRWVLLSPLPHTTAAFPGKLTGRLPHQYLSRPAQRSLAFRPACSLDRQAIRFIRGFDGFVTYSAAPIATGWSDPLPGGFSPTGNRRLSRRTIFGPYARHEARKRLNKTRPVDHPPTGRMNSDRLNTSLTVPTRRFRWRLVATVSRVLWSTHWCFTDSINSTNLGTHKHPCPRSVGFRCPYRRSPDRPRSVDSRRGR